MMMKLVWALILAAVPVMAIHPRRLRRGVTGKVVPHRRLDMVDDVTNAVLKTPGIQAQLQTLLNETGYTNGTALLHDVVGSILMSIGYPVNFTDSGLYGDLAMDDDSAEGYYGENFTDIGNPAFDLLNPTEGSGLDFYLAELGQFSAINTSLVDLSCNVATPSCAYNRGGDAGVWVCRSLYHPLDGSKIQWNACVNPAEKELKTDTCGCCGGKCEVACACGCTLADGSKGTGSWVTTADVMESMSVFEWLTTAQQENADLTTATVCVPSAVATTLVARPGNGISCVAQCPKA